MCIIQINKPKLYLTVCALSLIGVVGAAQAAEWPQTFTGQPDFDFKRGEILKEYKENELPDDDIERTTTLDNMLFEKVNDPFSLPGAENNEAENDIVTLPSFASGEGLNIVSPQLPTLDSATAQADLGEFEAFIEKIIAQKREVKKKDLKNFDFEDDVQRVTIQSIVTSPHKYAVINNVRYEEGDRFILPVSIKLTEKGLESLINQYLPNPKTVDEETFKEYTKLRDQAIEKYKKKVGDNNVDAVQHNVSVTIRKIEHRRIVVSIFGKEYALKMKWVL